MYIMRGCWSSKDC